MSVTIYPDTETWLASRVTTLGASEIAAVIGANKYRSAMQVYTSKVNGNVEPETPKMRAGKLFERSIAELWAGENDYKLIEPPLFAYNNVPGKSFAFIPDAPPTSGYAVWQLDNTPLTCTPDFFASDEGGVYVVEIKNVTPELARIDTAKGGWKQGPPLHYIVQVQAQMMVLRENGVKFEHGILVAYFGGDDVRPYEIQPDPDLWKVMQFEAGKFGYLVAAKTPPSPDQYTTSDDMSKAYRKCAMGKTADVPIPVVIALRDAREQFKACETAKDKAEAEFKAYMKDAEIALCEGVPVAMWKEKTVNYKAKAASTSTQRPFLFNDSAAATAEARGIVPIP